MEIIRLIQLGSVWRVRCRRG